MSCLPPTTFPLVTPGPIRIHRPLDSTRFQPDELPASAILSALGESQAANWSPFTSPASGNLAALPPAGQSLLDAQQLIRRLDLGQFKDEVYTFIEEIFNSVLHRKPLDNFLPAMLNKYHAPFVLSKTPQDTMAALALLRRVACDMGGETKKRMTTLYNKTFLPKVEAYLTKFFKDNGEDHKGSAWLRWENNIIQYDKTRFPDKDMGNAIPAGTVLFEEEHTDGAAADGIPPATLDQEPENAVILETQTLTFNLYQPSTIPMNFPPKAMNNKVQLGDLGDVALELTLNNRL
ncbi:hypothetical protein GY45DRAFT_1375830 [Cubamyces sp. BRFM 1775]|nr:hypothetical protein GY45DRAFT_1375830 [Cubamyces sp. BRFM 1775]